MFHDDEFTIIDLKDVKKMDGVAKTEFMNDLCEEFQDHRNSNPMRLFYCDLLSILIKNHGN